MCPEYTEFVYRSMKVLEAALPWFRLFVVVVTLFVGAFIGRWLGE